MLQTLDDDRGLPNLKWEQPRPIISTPTHISFSFAVDKHDKKHDHASWKTRWARCPQKLCDWETICERKTFFPTLDQATASCARDSWEGQTRGRKTGGQVGRAKMVATVDQASRKNWGIHTGRKLVRQAGRVVWGELCGLNVEWWLINLPPPPQQRKFAD